MSSALLPALLTSASGAGAGLAAPRVVARLREPAAYDRELDSDRMSFADIAAVRHLAPLLAALGASSGAVVGWRLGWTPALGAWTYLNAVCLLLGYVDLRTRLLPTQLIAPSYAVVGLLLGAAAVSDASWTPLRQALLGWLLMGGFYLLMWRFGPPGLGYGDVRLAGLLAPCLGFLGWGELVGGLYGGFLLGGAASVVLLLARRITVRTHIPFGPFMMLGALAGLVWGGPLAAWYAAA